MAQTRVPKSQLDTTVVDTTSSQVLGNKDLTAGTNTFPTLNQNTTGSAAKWTTARNLAGNSVDGSANIAFTNKFIVQGTTDSGLSGAQFLGSLSTGLIKNTTTTGVLSIASAGTDYQAPITLTTTGSSGAATFISNTLNIPQYSVGFANPMTTLGDIIYENATPAPTRLAGNTTTATTYLSQTGNGTISATPVWKQFNASESFNGTVGSGAIVLNNSPNLVTPTLGTPASGVATNLTGTASGLTAGTVTTNANLTGPITSVGNATSIASQTGTGTKFVVDTSPTLVTPTLGVATTTSINKLTITAPATSATLSLITGSTLATAGAFSTTLTATGATNVTLPTSGTLYGTASGSITSSQLATSLSDETGTGSSVFATSPLMTTPNIAGGSSTPATPTTGQGIFFGVGTGAVRPHWMSSTGTDEIIQTSNTVGYITGAQITTSFNTTSTTPVQVTGLTATFTANGISRYKVTVYAPSLTAAGTQKITLSLWSGTVGSGTQLQDSRTDIYVASAEEPGTLVYYTPTAPSSGSNTYNIGMKVAAANQGTLSAGATQPAFVLIEAI